MLDKLVEEKLYEFLHKAYCALEGVNSEDKCNWHIGIFDPEMQMIGVPDQRDPKRIRLIDRGFGTLSVVEYALRDAGIKVCKSPLDRYGYEGDLERRGGYAIAVDLSGDKALNKLDLAITRLSAAKTEYVLDKLAHVAALMIKGQFKNTTLPCSMMQEHAFAYTIDEKVLRALSHRISEKLNGDAHVSDEVSSQSKAGRNIEAAAKQIAKHVKLTIIDNNRRHPDYPLPKFDSRIVERLCGKIEVELNKLVVLAKTTDASNGRGADGWVR